MTLRMMTLYDNDCFFRTEANDLALRLARTYTKHNDAVVLDRFVTISQNFKFSFIHQIAIKDANSEANKMFLSNC